MVLERTYTIPLRREWLKTGRFRRTKRAVNAIRTFLARHMKAELDDVRLGKHLNLEMWKHGIKNPPGRVKVNVVKDDKGIVRAEIVGAPKEVPKVEPKAKKPAAPATPAVKPAEKKPEQKPAEAKPAEQKPAAPATKPVEKKPTEQKPVEQKPAAKPEVKPAAPAQQKIIQ